MEEAHVSVPPNLLPRILLKHTTTIEFLVMPDDNKLYDGWSFAHMCGIEMKMGNIENSKMVSALEQSVLAAHVTPQNCYEVLEWSSRHSLSLLTEKAKSVALSVMTAPPPPPNIVLKFLEEGRLRVTKERPAMFVDLRVGATVRVKDDIEVVKAACSSVVNGASHSVSWNDELKHTVGRLFQVIGLSVSTQAAILNTLDARMEENYYLPYNALDSVEWAAA